MYLRPVLARLAPRSLFEPTQNRATGALRVCLGADGRRRTGLAIADLLRCRQFIEVSGVLPFKAKTVQSTVMSTVHSTHGGAGGGTAQHVEQVVAI